MTRFARAKGSKASNEKLPEAATSWSEMKQELLNKNQELEENQKRESAVKQRQENYEAFLRETEEEAAKKIVWADFPELKSEVKQEKSPTKRKSSLSNANGFTETASSNKKVKKFNSVQPNGDDLVNVESEDSDGQFSALKSQIEEVLSKQNENDCHSDDEPPEEVGIKQQPQEVAIKKVKKPKQKLKIVLKKEQQLLSETLEISLKKKEQENSGKESIKKQPVLKEDNLTEKQKKLIEKKRKRKMKQEDTKRLKKLMQGEIKEAEDPETNKVIEKAEVSPQEQLKHQKKLERRMRQKEKIKMKRALGIKKKGALNAENNTEKLVDPTDKQGESSKTSPKKMEEENLTETQKRLIEKKRQRKKKQDQQRKLKRRMEKETKKVGDPKNDKIIDKTKEKTEQSALEQSKQQKRELKIKKELNANAEKPARQTDQQVNNNNNTSESPKTAKNNGISREPTNKHNKPFNEPEFTDPKPFQKPQNKQQLKKGKPRDNREHQSRKFKPETMFINGKTIEVDYVDGFPVKKEDADRLKKLRREMISKGLPRSEINFALKLERRRAEKAFAREKKNVCFNCRKSGHNLSECPELNKDQVADSAGTGICFKCGSTEHTHFECKVVRGLDYKFATCFICKEQGHIAKQCPDNQRGLYPKGGACKVCGDVTHLKRDCPRYQAQQVQMQNSLSIGTLGNGNPDDLEGMGSGSSFSRNLKRPNKVVKF